MMNFASRTLASALLLSVIGCGSVTVDLRADGEGSTSGGSTGSSMDDAGVDPTCGAAGLGPIPGTASSIAIRNEGSGWLEIDISTDADATCEDKYHFPAGCASAWRVRLELAPNQQSEGTYVLGDHPNVFAYLDAQEPGGVNCTNAGHDLVGTLRIDAIGAQQVVGSICGTGEYDGTFTASVCAMACKGTGQACTSDAECCTLFCGGGSCDP